MKQNNQDDLNYFRQSMEGVRPLRQDQNNKAIFKKILTNPVSKTKSRLELKSNSPTNLQDISTKNIHSEEKLFFTRPGGLQHNLLQKLRQGKIKMRQYLDLHGMVVEKARRAIEQFIQTSSAHNHRYVLIIHGKGKSSQDTPTLKNHVNHWLMQMPTVLAFCSAAPKDGGTGALYVVLKNTLAEI